MPSTITVYRIFISGTSEVSEDFSFIKSFFEKWNATNQDRGIMFQPLTWIDNVGPEVGTEAQDIIDSVITDFDGYIGLVWTRIGTPTAREKSGVIHEYKTAMSKLNDGSCMHVALLFKITPKSMNQIEPEQFIELTRFKDSVKSDGLYREYDTQSQLDSLLHLFTRRFIDKIGTSSKIIATKIMFEEESVGITNSGVDTHEKDLGLFEIDELLGKNLSDISNYAYNIQSEIEYCGEITSAASQNLETLKNINLLNKESAVDISNRVASAMIKTASNISNLNKLHKPSSKSLIDNMPSYIDVLADFNDRTNTTNTLDAAIKAKSAMEYANSSLVELINTIESLPRINKSISIAKRKLSSALQESNQIMQEISDSFSLFIKSQF